MKKCIILAMSDNKEQLSPMLAHWRSVKDSQKDAIVLYRAGDFYEMFFEDALLASSELDLVLTGKNAGLKEKAPMCGVPARSVNQYIQKLVQLGHKVAIVEQMEDPKTAKGMVKRDVIRIVTPGTFVEVEDDKTTITIGSLVDNGIGYLLTLVDMASGYVCIKRLEHQLASVIQEIKVNNCKEIIVNQMIGETNLQGLRQVSGLTISYCEENKLKDSYVPLIGSDDVFIKLGCAILFNYLEITQKTLLAHLQPIEIIDYAQQMKLDYASLVNLELTSAPHSQSNMCLWTYMDHCQSAMGSRLLKKWIESPLLNESVINHRLDQVAFLVNNVLLRASLKESLAKIYDIQRLCARLAMNTIHPMDLLRLGKTLEVLPDLKRLLSDPLFNEYTQFDTYDNLCHEILTGLVENPPLSSKEGGIFNPGYNEALDEIKSAITNNKQWLLDYESSQKELTGIKNLRIVYSRNFGYCLEVSKGQVNQVKEEFGYIRRQTLTNVERYTTNALKEHEDLLINGQSKAVALESQLFDALKDKAKQYVYQFQRIASCIATMDCLYALSIVSSQKGFTRPTFGKNCVINQGKHPLLDELMKRQSIGNDVNIDASHCIQLITGPNMGGKSTYMRMVAITSVMAQMGCFILAKQAMLPLYDAIYTRIGASDDLSSGQSTFMVEMNEANYALRHATKHSLIIFDEIGRGTSTYDGMALAQGMIEFIANNIHANTLFSTHYHELTHISASVDCVNNIYASVNEHEDTIEFTYKIKQGNADRSYGIHVAKLANLPYEVLDKANRLVHQLESKQTVIQPSLFDQPTEVQTIVKPSETLKTLAQMDPNNITPMQALQLLVQLKEMAEKEYE